MKKIFLFVLLSLILCLPAFGQNTPGTLNYPTSLDNLDSLFRTADKAQSTLSATINSSAATIAVSSASSFPSSGAVVIESEIIFYTGKSGNSLTGAIRGASGTTAVFHPSGAAVKGAIFAVHHNTQSQAIIDLQTKLGIGNTTTDSNKFLIGSSAGTSVWRVVTASDIPALDTAKTTSGNFATARIVTGTVTNSRCLKVDGSGNIVTASADCGTGGGSGIASLSDDANPQLGGDLDLNSFRVGSATEADLSKLNAITATSAELNYTDGVTSAIQAQIDSKANLTQSINLQTGTSYTFQASDLGKTVVLSNASAIAAIVPSGLGQGFWCNVVQGDAGQITFTPSSTTINNYSGDTKTAGQFAATTILATAANTFILTGQTTN